MAGQVRHHFVEVRSINGRAQWIVLGIPSSMFIDDSSKDLLMDVARSYIREREPAAFYFVTEQMDGQN